MMIKLLLFLGIILSIVKANGLDGLAYSNFKHNYKDHWGIERKMGKGYPVIVTHWMPLPNSPKKEQK